MIVIIEFTIFLFHIFFTKVNIKKLLEINFRSVVSGISLGLFFFFSIFLLSLIPNINHVFTRFISGVHLDFGFIFLFYVLAVAFSEEYIFRVTLPKYTSQTISLILFTIFHFRLDFPLEMFLFVFLFGFIQTLFWTKSHSFVALVISHIFTTISLFLLF